MADIMCGMWDLLTWILAFWLLKFIVVWDYSYCYYYLCFYLGLFILYQIYWWIKIIINTECTRCVHLVTLTINLCFWIGCLFVQTLISLVHNFITAISQLTELMLLRNLEAAAYGRLNPTFLFDRYLSVITSHVSAVSTPAFSTLMFSALPISKNSTDTGELIRWVRCNEN